MADEAVDIKKEKPPTQGIGVGGIDAHGTMGEFPSEPQIDWYRVVSLPAFEMFVFEQSGFTAYPALSEWVENRREALGDEKLYKLYSDWHKDKGYWPTETPMGALIQEVK